MENDRKYNGWTNYETWCVNLWFENDEGLYRDLLYLAQEADNVYDLSQDIKAMVEEWTPEVTGLFADLINAALSEVDWQEIAQQWWDAAYEDEDEE